jgi:hypothetical protein
LKVVADRPIAMRQAFKRGLRIAESYFVDFLVDQNH